MFGAIFGKDSEGLTVAKQAVEDALALDLPDHIIDEVARDTIVKYYENNPESALKR